MLTRSQNGKELEGGDLVKMKSGGPLMTVSGVNAITEHATVWWFSAESVALHENMPFSVLEKYDGGTDRGQNIVDRIADGLYDRR